MTVIRLSGFAGENRAIHPKLLNETVGVTSLNQKPGRGDLRPWKTPTTVATVPGGRQTIYRMGRDVASDSQYWLSWTGAVHAVRGFDEADTTERTYYTGDGAPKVTDNTIALASTPYPTANRPLGLPAPVSAPTVNGFDPAGATENVVRDVVRVSASANYVRLNTATPHTFQAGESVWIDVDYGASNLTGTVVVVTTPTSSSFTYQSIGAVIADQAATGSATVARPVEPPDDETYFYVYTYFNDWGWESAPSPVSAQVDRPPTGYTELSGFASVPSGNYNVTGIRIYKTQAGSSGSADFYYLGETGIAASGFTDTNQTLGEVCPTTTWLTPPANLTNLTSLWNGMLAGISGNSVRFCEAYTPYAWPVAYDIVPPDSKPVALGVFGQSLLVLTTGRPLLVAGSSPDAMDQQPLEIPQGCVSAKSAVSMGSGVAWASNDGLMWYGSGGAKNLTAGLMTREDWLALVPSTISGRMYEGLYFGSYNDGSGVKGFLIDPSNPQGVFFLSAGYAVTHFDELQDQLYVLSGGNVQRWDSGAAMTVTFKSKVFRQVQPITLACCEIVADGFPFTFRIWADGALKHTQTVTSGEPFRLPSGFMATDWQIEVSGTQAIQAVIVASSMEELKGA